MQRIIVVNRRREIFQVKRVYWQPRYVLLVANSTYRNIETTFEFSREALQELANALLRREQTQQRELALMIDFWQRRERGLQPTTSCRPRSGRLRDR